MSMKHIKLGSQIQLLKKYNFIFWNLILASKPLFCWVGKKNKLRSVPYGHSLYPSHWLLYHDSEILQNALLRLCSQVTSTSPSTDFNSQLGHWSRQSLWDMSLWVFESLRHEVLSINLDSWHRHFSLDHVTLLVSCPDYKHRTHQFPSFSPLSLSSLPLPGKTPF